MGVPNALLALLPLIPPALLFVLYAPVTVYRPVMYSVLLSMLGCIATIRLIPVLAQYSLRKGLWGHDLGKRGLKGYNDDTKIPESLGAITGIVYIFTLIVFQMYHFLDSPDGVSEAELNAAMLSICLTLFLGFADDVLDLPWRYKIVFPFFTSVPLLIAYSGSTYVIVPKLLRSVLGPAVELGVLYRLYMSLVTVFSSNCINMLAGINGLEAGQALIIACSMLAHNVLELNGASAGAHLFSIYMLVPFVGVTLGLLRHNWFPSSVFVGDSYTYFAGIVLGVTGVLGHFSKTLMLFFIPQLINFAISLPEMFGYWGPCPRHRLPKVNPKTGLLEARPAYCNVVTQTLRMLGPMSERSLCIAILIFQAVCSVIAISIRYPLAQLLF